MKLTMSRSLSQRDKTILLLLGVVVVLLLVYLIGVRPALNQLSNLAEERSSLEQTLASLGQVHARQQQTEERGKSVLSRVPIGAHEANALELLNQIAEQDHVTLVSVAYGNGTSGAPSVGTSGGSTSSSTSGSSNASQGGGGLSSLQYNVVVTGTTANLESFFADLATAPRLMTVQLQSVSGTASGDTANFTLAVYYRNG
ncbi:type II secretion system protein GspM [Alicyclobacillus sendaiensis]|uniref:Type II secretion system protein GspM n=1 Tax=Alicyclobacillus sendaiensis PA2 TaxID=3029425 RepID=A0ABT6Y0H5_ALISE|nr:type II secretion system protein GspM [Alicyclobacillus sendaiensis]MDI9260828.1 type II secretion system protein GspM [Alicyclobacillus sendaiensis PA2]